MVLLFRKKKSFIIKYTLVCEYDKFTKWVNDKDYCLGW